MPSITVNWTANPATDNIDHYDVHGAVGTGVAFGSCPLLASVSALTWTQVGLPYSEAHTYYIVAVNAIGPSAPEGPLNISTPAPGASFRAVRVVTAAGAVTVTAADWAIIVKKTSGAATVVNLPAGILEMEFVIKDGKGDASTHNITVTPNGGDTIDGAATFVLNNDYQAVDLVFGTEWSVL